MAAASFERILQLVTSDRLRASTRGTKSILIETESDKGRVVNFSAFRRLLGKAQVFPLDTNAQVRTRLTHSIEVSQVGRHIAQKIIESHDALGQPYERLAGFVNVIETACLLHDIGNPPYGHFGESAIQKCFLDDHPDLSQFDGNPQGFRIVSFLGGADAFGLNLTCTLLLSMVKYPWTYNTKPKTEKKIGLFRSDWAYYESACAKLGWSPEKKFPLMRVMEAADNIAYAMSDLEDGLEKKIVSLKDLMQQFGSERFKTDQIPPFVKFKTSVISDAVSLAAATFTKEEDKIMAGEETQLIDKQSEIGALLDSVKTFARETIYSSREAERIELAGRSVILGLLKHFRVLLSLSETDFLAIVRNTAKGKGLDYEARLFRMLPENYVSKYGEESRSDEGLRRAHLIVDFVSGMTDEFALETYQILEGIRIK